MYVSDYNYQGFWENGAYRVELFDVLSLLKHLDLTLTNGKFNQALKLLNMTAEEYSQLTPLLNSLIVRPPHATAPQGRWNKLRAIKTFNWVYGNREDAWRLVAETLDFARVIRATPADLLDAGQSCNRYNYMTWQDWHILMDSGATTFGSDEGLMFPSLFQKHVKGSRKAPKK